MVERFGIQDHDARLTQHAQQNPTNSSGFQNLGGGDAAAPSSPSGGYFPGPRMIIATFRAVHEGRKRIPKRMWLGIVLALVFGPFGLIYATWTGAVVLTGLTILAGFIRGGGHWAALDSDGVMQPIWRLAVVAAVLWMIMAIRAHNARAHHLTGG
jgi:hypothetical protein